MDVQFWAATDVGKARDHNEDNFLVDKRLNLFIVCDGMGGHAAGEVASAVAVRAIRDVVANNREVFEKCAQNTEDAALRQDLLRVLEYAIQEACTRIFDMAQENAERRGMGTTCSMMMVAGRRCFIAHVGDSRIYLYRKGQVHQLTEDHTLINEMLRRGRIQEAEGVDSKYKNAITRAVGVYESVEVDTLDFDTLPGDRFMLCSDGLCGYFEDNDSIAQHVAPSDPEMPPTQEELRDVANHLVQFANDCGGKDNITVVLVGICEEIEGIEADDVHLTMETIRNIPLFHYLNYKELVRIVNLTIKRIARPGEVVIEEGEEGDELFIIMRGQFIVERKGRELARLGPGSHFGEMALIDDGKRSATVIAQDEATLLIVRRREFYELLRKDPTLAVKLLWNFIQTLSSRLRDVPDAPQADPRRRFIDEITGNNVVPPSALLPEFDDEQPVVDGDITPVPIEKAATSPELPVVRRPLPLPAQDDDSLDDSLDDSQDDEILDGDALLGELRPGDNPGVRSTLPAMPVVRPSPLPPRPGAIPRRPDSPGMTLPPRPESPGVALPPRPGVIPARPSNPPAPPEGIPARPGELPRRHTGGSNLSSAITSAPPPPQLGFPPTSSDDTLAPDDDESIDYNPFDDQD